MKQEKIVFRRSLISNIAFFLICLAFVIGGFFLLEEIWILGMITMIFFGGGGVLYLLFMSWRPILVITKEGVTVPYGWGENFVSWSNVRKIEMVTQTINTGNGTTTKDYIGVFTFNNEGIVGAGDISKAITSKVTGIEDPPSLLITNSLTFIKYDKILAALNEFYVKYNNK